MNTSSIEYDPSDFEKFDVTLQAALKTDFLGYEVTAGIRAISVMVELSEAPSTEFLRESHDQNALVVPAHATANALFVSANGSIDWLNAIVKLPSVVAIELTSQLRPARANQRLASKDAIAPSPQVQSDKNTILGIIDHGCPIFHRDLIDKDSNISRVLALWDQDDSPDFAPLHTCPETMGYGGHIFRENINEWIKQSKSKSSEFDEDFAYDIANYPALRSRFTHGAMTSGLFAGPQKSPSLGGFITGSEHATNDEEVKLSDIVFIQLPRRGLLAPSTAATNRSILDGLRYILGCAGAETEDIVVCISYGNIQGPHDGSSMIERAIDAMVDEAGLLGKKLKVIFASGNTFNKPTLAKINLLEKSTAKLAWNLPPDAETVMTAEIWIDKANLPQSIEVLAPVQLAEKIIFNFKALRQETRVIKAGGNTIGVVVVKICGPNVLLMVHWLAPTIGSPAVVSFQQRWQFIFTSDDKVNKPIYCYLAWGGKNLGFEQRVRPSSWLALSEGVDITGDGSLLGTACGKKSYVIGACEKWGSNRRTAYSGSGVPRGGTKVGVNCLAVAEESVWLPGIVCIGTRSGSLTRMNGSSVAAPQAARTIAHSGSLKTKTSIPTWPPSAKIPPPSSGKSSAATSVATEPILDNF